MRCARDSTSANLRAAYVRDMALATNVLLNEVTPQIGEVVFHVWRAGIDQHGFCLLKRRARSRTAHNPA